MDIIKTLFRLAGSAGVSGDESDACETAAKELEKYADNVLTDDFGNVIGEIGRRTPGKPHLLLDAHIDEIGFIVTYITDDGFLKISNCGGTDRRLLAAQQVTVYGREKVLGVITSIPPHLEKDNKTAFKLEDVFVDTGMTADEVKKLVSPGDRVVIENMPCRLLGDRITSKSLDDRAGIAVLLMVCDLLKGEELPVSLTVLFSSQEETGERGAAVAAYKINPDMAVVVDVSFAKTGDESPHKCGELSKGPMIGISPSLSRIMSENMIKTAKKHAIPYQIEVMGGVTGTNADCIGTSREGVRTVTVSVPLKYMHTPVEVISVSDIESSAKLIAEFIRGYGRDA